MSFRVMTCNILDDGVGREPPILEVVHAAQPDTAILEEVGRLETAETFAAALHLNLGFARGNSKRHLDVLSRFPILACHRDHPWPLSTTLPEATIELVANQSVRLFGVHLAAQPFALFEVWRWWEIKTLLRRIQLRSAEACLMAGDFNAIAPRDAVDIRAWPRRLKRTLAWQGGRVHRRSFAEVASAAGKIPN